MCRACSLSRRYASQAAPQPLYRLMNINIYSGKHSRHPCIPAIHACRDRTPCAIMMIILSFISVLHRHHDDHSLFHFCTASRSRDLIQFHTTAGHAMARFMQHFGSTFRVVQHHTLCILQESNSGKFQTGRTEVKRW